MKTWWKLIFVLVAVCAATLAGKPAQAQEAPPPWAGTTVVVAANTWGIAEVDILLRDDAPPENLEYVLGLVLEACPAEGGIWLHRKPDSIHYSVSYPGGLPETCQEYVKKQGFLFDGLTMPTVEELAQLAAETGQPALQEGYWNRILVLDQASGFFAVIPHTKEWPDLGASCLHASLVEIGWRGNPEDLVALRAPTTFPNLVSDVLNRTLSTRVWSRGPVIPDFCGGAAVVEIPKPEGVTVTVARDSFEIRVDFLSVRIHTDPEECTLYREGFPQGEYLVEFVIDPDGDRKNVVFALMSPDSLVEFELFGSSSWLASVRDGELRFYQRGDARSWYERLGSIQVARYADGQRGPIEDISPPSPYVIVTADESVTIETEVFQQYAEPYTAPETEVKQ